MIKLNLVHLYKDSVTSEKSIIINYAIKRLKKNIYDLLNEGKIGIW